MRSELVAALTADEFVTPLAPVLHRVQQEAVKLLTDPGVAVIDPPLPPPGLKEESGLSMAAAQTELGRLAKAIEDGTVEKDSVEVTIRWTERAAEPDSDEGAG